MTHPELFDALRGRAADAMVLSDAEGIVIAANPAYFQLYGYADDAVVGHSFVLMFPPEQPDWAIAQYQRVFADPASVTQYESVIRRADGAQRAIEAQITFLHAMFTPRRPAWADGNTGERR